MLEELYRLADKEKILETVDFATPKMLTADSFTKDIKEYAKLISSYHSQNLSFSQSVVVQSGNSSSVVVSNHKSSNRLVNNVQINVSSGGSANGININVNSSSNSVHGINADPVACEIRTKLTKIIDAYWNFEGGKFQPLLQKLIVSAESLYGFVDPNNVGDTK